MPAVTEVSDRKVRGRGSVVEFSFDGGTTWAVLPGLQTIPAVGDEVSFSESSSIDKVDPEYDPDPATYSPWAIAFEDIGADPTQDLLIAAADNTDTIKVRVTYTTGRVASFDLICSGHRAEEIGKDDYIMHAINSQPTGAVVWSKVA